MKEKQLNVGDIITITDGDTQTLGKVVEFSEDGLLLNNSDLWFDFEEWEYTILHSEQEKTY